MEDDDVARLAGVGGFLKAEAREGGFWDVLFSFNEHRLADCWVHLGVALKTPYRLDHWLALALHVRKYSGHAIPRRLATPVLRGALSLDNLLDCVAHTISGLVILGPFSFFFAVLLAELQRCLLDLDIAAHHARDFRRRKLRGSFLAIRASHRLRRSAADKKSAGTTTTREAEDRRREEPTATKVE